MLVRQGRIQDALILEPAADELQSDRQAFLIESTGNRAARQPEHAREAQEIGMVVARMARVVAIPLEPLC